ncbi:hypothetical protein [uncultured Desulfosarcina sp.]|uniref:hypothetical protein n=1 Tax=uncultured Desulfosarcina sp. TaxID=218289 RepID=UPI0029C8AB77|nr:hypothetical protein [uncultured Desulfosarcina sp.]
MIAVTPFPLDFGYVWPVMEATECQFGAFCIGTLKINLDLDHIFLLGQFRLYGALDHFAGQIHRDT